MELRGLLNGVGKAVAGQETAPKFNQASLTWRRKIVQKVPAYSLYFPLRQAAIIGLKVARQEWPELEIFPKDVASLFNNLSTLVKAKVFSNPYSLDGNYWLWPPEKVSKICQNTTWNKASGTNRREIAFLSTTLESLSWALYYDIHRNSGFEIHGPYDVSSCFGPNSVLVVKEGHNLAPEEVWPERYIYRTISLYLIYRDVDIDFDFFNRQYSSRPIVNNLIDFAVLANNIPVSTSTISEIENNLTIL